MHYVLLPFFLPFPLQLCQSGNQFQAASFALCAQSPSAVSTEAQVRPETYPMLLLLSFTYVNVQLSLMENSGTELR